MHGWANIVRRLLAVVLAVLITVPVSVMAPIAGPAAAGVRAAPAKPAGGDKDLSGDRFYDSARGMELMEFGAAMNLLGSGSRNFAGNWFVSPASGSEAAQIQQVMHAIWDHEPNLAFKFTSSSTLQTSNPALYKELVDTMGLKGGESIFQTAAVNEGLQGGLHSEDYLLLSKASEKYVRNALKAGKSPAEIEAKWNEFKEKYIKDTPGQTTTKDGKVRNITRHKRNLSALRKALREGFDIDGVHVDPTKLDPSSLTERQTCGSKSGKGCTAGAPDAGHAVSYKESRDQSMAAIRVLTYRSRWTVRVMLNQIAGGKQVTPKQVALFKQVVGAAATKAYGEKTSEAVEKARLVAVRGLRITYAGAVLELLEAGDTATAKQVYEAGNVLYPGGKDQPTFQSLQQKVAQGQATGKKVATAFQTTPSPVTDCGPGALGGHPAGLVPARIAALPADPCGKNKKGAQKAVPTGLQKSIAAAAAGQNGGIDFSSLDLRYMADKPAGNDTSSIRYAFSGKPTNGDPNVAQGVKDVKQASDAFFVWLALPQSSFWVNLNPDEPDRIMDPKMGQTDAGRVMLTADLGLKDADSRWIDPRSSTGKKFWDGLQGKCFSFRLWIVPGPADVYDGGDELYIEKAPLKVMMESSYFKTKGIKNLAGCEKADPSADDHNEALYRSLILPKVTKLVNTDAKYAELRRVYRSRIAAEWYRRRSVQHATAYKPIIDSGDISKWKYAGSWTPQQTFEKYKGRLGKHRVTLKTRRGDYIYKTTYTYGGVDWTNLPYTSQGRAAFQKAEPNLGAQVGRSLNGPVNGDGGDLLLGGAVPVAHADAAAPTGPPAFLVGFLLLLGVPVVVAAGGVALGGTLTRRRRRPAGPNGVR